jgi:integrase
MGIASPLIANPTTLKYEDIRKDYSGLDRLDGFFGGRRVVSITTDLLRTFVRERKLYSNYPVRNSTVNRDLAVLRHMMNLALREGKLEFLPAFPFLPENRPQKRLLEPKDFERLRNELPQRLRPVVTFMYLTGRPLGGARAIQCEDVNFDALEIRLGGLVAGFGPIIIPLGGLEGFVEALKRKKVPRREYAEATRVENDDSCDSSSAPLFCTTNLRKQWRRACIRLGFGRMEMLPGQREVYTGLLVQHLRRSAIRNMLEAGVHKDVAMRIAGYKRREATDQNHAASAVELHDAIKKVLEKTGIPRLDP